MRQARPVPEDREDALHIVRDRSARGHRPNGLDETTTCGATVEAQTPYRAVKHEPALYGLFYVPERATSWRLAHDESATNRPRGNGGSGGLE